MALRSKTHTAQDAIHDLGYEQLRQDLCAAVRKTCPPALRDRSDDLVQLAMLKVLAVEERNDSRENGSSSTTAPSAPEETQRAGKGTRSSSYLYRVAYSVVIDEWRRSRCRSEISFSEDPFEANDADNEMSHEILASSDPDPARASASSEVGRGIGDCLQRLNDNRRRAVTLYLLGHTVPEASRVLRSNLKRTESLVYRGLADLRRCLALKGLDP